MEMLAKKPINNFAKWFAIFNLEYINQILASRSLEFNEPEKKKEIFTASEDTFIQIVSEKTVRPGNRFYHWSMLQWNRFIPFEKMLFFNWNVVNHNLI